MKEETALNMYEALERATMAKGIMHTIQLHNDYIDQVDGPDKLTADEVKASYFYLYKALGNMHELNQHMMRNLDDVACYLYDVADELSGNDEPF